MSLITPAPAHTCVERPHLPCLACTIGGKVVYQCSSPLCLHRQTAYAMHCPKEDCRSLMTLLTNVTLEERKSVRINEVEEQLMKLATEFYELVAPTPQEIEAEQDVFWDDIKAEAECLVDPASGLGKWNLAAMVMGVRQDEAEEEKRSAQEKDNA